MSEAYKKQLFRQLEQSCNNCHYTWQPVKTADNLTAESLEKKLLVDIKYEPTETIPAFTLLSYVFFFKNKLKRSEEYSLKAYELSLEDNICNGYKYVATAVHLHTLFYCSKWTEMNTFFDEIELITLTKKDKCQIELTRGHACKKAGTPYDNQTVEAYKMAQYYDDMDPEGYFQMALVFGRKRRAEGEKYILDMTADEENALEKAISLWENCPQNAAYPKVLQALANLERTITQNPNLKDRTEQWRQLSNNYQLVKTNEIDICTLFRHLQKHYRNVNHAYDKCYVAYNELSRLSLPDIDLKRINELKNEIIDKARSECSDDTTIAYHAGKHYFYQRKPGEAKKCFEQCLQSPKGNKFAEAFLLQIPCIQECDIVTKVEILHRKYKDSPDIDCSRLYTQTAKLLGKHVTVQKDHLFKAIRLNPKFQQTVTALETILLREAHEADSQLAVTGISDVPLKCWYALGELYLTSDPPDKVRSYEYLEKVYKKNPNFEDVAELFCKALLLNDDKNLLDKTISVALHSKNKKNISEAYLLSSKKENINEEEKLNHLLFACKYGSSAAANHILEIIENTTSFSYHMEKAYQYCAMVSIADVFPDEHQKSKITAKMNDFLRIDNDDNIPQNAPKNDLLLLRKKRFQLCCSYVSTIGPEALANNDTNDDLNHEELLYEAELVLLFTRIVLDRAFKWFHNTHYKNAPAIYYPHLSSLPENNEEAHNMLLQKLQDDYQMINFEDEFPALLSFLADHQSSKADDAFLLRYFQFTNHSKHERSITGKSFLRKMRKLISHAGDPMYGFTQRACDYTEEVVIALYTAQKTNVLPRTITLHGHEHTDGMESVLISAGYLLDDYNETLRKSKKWEVKDILSSPNLTNVEAMMHIKERQDMDEFDFVVFQLSTANMPGEDFSAVKTLGEICIFSHDMMSISAGTKIIIGGIPNVFHNLNVNPDKVNAEGQKLTEMLKVNCSFIENLYFTDMAKFKPDHFRENGVTFNQKGTQMWIRNIQNKLDIIGRL